MAAAAHDVEGASLSVGKTAQPVVKTNVHATNVGRGAGLAVDQPAFEITRTANAAAALYRWVWQSAVLGVGLAATAVVVAYARQAHGGAAANF